MNILDRYIALTRQTFDQLIRLRLISLITKQVHSRDIVERLIKHQITDIQTFDWQMILRFFWERNEQQTEDCFIRQTFTRFKYQYVGRATEHLFILYFVFQEYLGATTRLIISPLTERCFITLTTALSLYRGGSLTGPAGKTISLMKKVFQTSFCQ